MTTFILTIGTDNSAYDGDPRRELLNNLHTIEKSLALGVYAGQVFDSNGNHVGAWELRAGDWRLAREG